MGLLKPQQLPSQEDLDSDSSSTLPYDDKDREIEMIDLTLSDTENQALPLPKESDCATTLRIGKFTQTKCFDASLLIYFL